jgi:uncharacterized protein YjiS (DUF1127 family)
MSLAFLSSPKTTATFLVGRGNRADTLARVGYLTIDRIGRLADTALRPIINLGGRVIAALIRAHRRRVAIGELTALGDRTLADLGLSRGDISSVVNELLDNAPRTRIRTLPRQAPAPARAPARRRPGNDNRPVRAA